MRRNKIHFLTATLNIARDEHFMFLHVARKIIEWLDNIENEKKTYVNNPFFAILLGQSTMYIVYEMKNSDLKFFN